jgi:hypothetical protein
LAGKINHSFWDSQIEDLYSLLNDLVSLKGKLHEDFNHVIWNDRVIVRLQKVIIQTVGHMYCHKIIPEDVLGELLNLEDTLHLAAFSRVFHSDWEGQITYKSHIYPENIPILNQWHSKNDKSSYTESKSKFEFLI